MELEDEEENVQLKSFITKWTTTTDNESIKLPVPTGKECDFVVNYGDGTEYTITSTSDPNITHTYEKAGTYTVTINGKVSYFTFSDVPDSKDKITELVQWGSVQVKNIDFEECSNLSGTIPVPCKGTFQNTTLVTGLFYGCPITGSIPENLFYEASQLQYLSNTFRDCAGLNGNIPPTLFSRVKNAEELSAAFKNCTGLTGTIPEDLFYGTPNLQYLDEIFTGCTGLTGEIPENLFINNAKVISLSYAFYKCSGLTGEIPANLFANTSKVTDLSYAFYKCSGLTGEIPANLFANNTELTYLSYAFFQCAGLTGEIPANLFANNPKLTQLPYAFSECENLTFIHSTMFDNNPDIVNCERTLSYCSELTGMAPALWERTNITQWERCYGNCEKLDNYAEIEKQPGWADYL